VAGLGPGRFGKDGAHPEDRSKTRFLRIFYFATISQLFKEVDLLSFAKKFEIFRASPIFAETT
jgi:hypothetical protein